MLLTVILVLGLVAFLTYRQWKLMWFPSPPVQHLLLLFISSVSVEICVCLCLCVFARLQVYLLMSASAEARWRYYISSFVVLLISWRQDVAFNLKLSLPDRVTVQQAPEISQCPPLTPGTSYSSVQFQPVPLVYVGLGEFEFRPLCLHIKCFDPVSHLPSSCCLLAWW